VAPRAHRQAHVSRAGTSDAMRRRRSNVLFLLGLAAASTLFLAATTKETAMLYLFALAFLALAGYIYLLAQLRQREMHPWPDAWPRG
jgi:Flp pilus assembly protein protease CpaA